MRSTPIYEVHAVKYAHLPRKAWEVQITPDPHDADFPMDYFVWVAIPLDESGHRTIGGKPIVIDTGFNAQVGKKRGREVKRNPADLLADLGIDAKEVEDVIITHLHYDHVGNWDKFPQGALPSAGQGDAVRHRPAHVPRHRSATPSRSRTSSAWCARSTASAWCSTTATRRSSPASRCT